MGLGQWDRGAKVTPPPAVIGNTGTASTHHGESLMTAAVVDGAMRRKTW